MKRNGKVLFIISLILNAVLLLGNAKLLPEIHINNSDSAPKGFYLITNDEPGKDDYVIVSKDKLDIDVEIYEYIPDSLLKKISFCENEAIIINEKGLYIDGNVIHMFEQAINEELNIEAIPYYCNIVLGDNEVFLMNEHPRSFDSRYFGAVSKDILRKAEPLWIF